LDIHDKRGPEPEIVHQKEDTANCDIKFDQSEVNTLENIAFWIGFSDRRPLLPASFSRYKGHTGRFFRTVETQTH
jgi:hypothetical protein